MRRQDRKVTDIHEIKGILNSTRIIHLGLMDGDYPYVVPLHFGYDEKSHGLQVLMKHQTGREFTFTEAMVNSVGVVQIKIVDYTAKRRRQLEQDVIMPPLIK